MGVTSVPTQTMKCPVSSTHSPSQYYPSEHGHRDKTQRNYLAEMPSYPFFLSSHWLLFHPLVPGDLAVHQIHCVLVTHQLLGVLGQSIE